MNIRRSKAIETHMVTVYNGISKTTKNYHNALIVYKRMPGYVLSSYLVPGSPRVPQCIPELRAWASV